MLLYMLIATLLHCVSVLRLQGIGIRASSYIEATRRLRRRGAMKARVVRLPEAVVGCGKDLHWFETTPGDLIALRIHSRDVAGAFTIVEARVLPLSGPPMHIHKERDEIFEVLTGVFRFQCGDDVFDISAGRTVVVPRGVPHAWVNLGAHPARLLFSFVPGGIDDLFEQIGKTPPDQWAALAALHDSFITGPPIVIEGASEPCRGTKTTNVTFLVPRSS
jgi:mannose-6-phosphate isomerase-like protein (cupin superfamily)